MEASFIEFYGKHKISPVRQDISDIKRHFERREGLYKQLGLLPTFFEGKTVLEVGPGSGYNSIYTASLKPKMYHLVEGNPTGVSDMERLFGEFYEWTNNAVIFPTILENYKCELLYDFVICEGMLPAMSDPTNLLQLLAKYVKPGGVLIITCIDSISGASENLRHLIGQLLIWDVDNVERMLSILLPVFSPHLNTLAAMSRRHDDWILDNIINPVGIAETLSISTAIQVLEDEFDVYCASLNMFTDWRWYKSLYGDNKSFNEMALNQYWTLVHNFIDYRKVLLPRCSEDNKKLYQLFDKFRIRTRDLVGTRNTSIIDELICLLDKIVVEIGSFSEELTQPFLEVLEMLRMDKIKPDLVANSANFKSYFGRGQQYLSFVRK